MTALVVAEHDNAHLRVATLNAVSAAKAVGGDVDILVAGDGCGAVAEQAAGVPGVARVRLVEAAHYRDQMAENLAELVHSLAAGYSHLVVAATTFGKNVMPRVAALLDVAQVSDVVGVVAADTFVRPIYAGNALATVRSTDAIKVLTVRTTAGDFILDNKTDQVLLWHKTPYHYVMRQSYLDPKSWVALDPAQTTPPVGIAGVGRPDGQP